MHQRLASAVATMVLAVALAGCMQDEPTTAQAEEESTSDIPSSLNITVTQGHPFAFTLWSDEERTILVNWTVSAPVDPTRPSYAVVGQASEDEGVIGVNGLQWPPAAYRPVGAQHEETNVRPEAPFGFPRFLPPYVPLPEVLVDAGENVLVVATFNRDANVTFSWDDPVRWTGNESQENWTHAVRLLSTDVEGDFSTTAVHTGPQGAIQATATIELQNPVSRVAMYTSGMVGSLEIDTPHNTQCASSYGILPQPRVVISHGHGPGTYTLSATSTASYTLVGHAVVATIFDFPIYTHSRDAFCLPP